MRAQSRTPIAIVWCGAVLASGCASLPDATIQYRLPKSTFDVMATRIIACDAAGMLVDSLSATVKSNYIAAGTAYKLSLTSLKGQLSDQDLKVERFEDGRLKSINSTAQGQGAEVVKSALAVAAAAAGWLGLKPPTVDKAKCDLIESWAGGKGKPLTLTYRSLIDPDDPDSIELVPTGATGVYISKLDVFLPSIESSFDEFDDEPPAPVIFAGGSASCQDKPEPLVDDRTTSICALQPGTAMLSLQIGSTILWQGLLQVPELGTYYRLPIMKPRPFGKEVMAATFAESGALLSIQYVANTGAAQSLSSTAGLYDAFHQTSVEKAAQLKADADVLAQQQRLVICRADPNSCK